jgi:sugar lactone lactonase YvrE
VTDSGTDSGPSATVLATFNQPVEGLWEVNPAAVEFIGTNGSPLTSLVVSAQPVTVDGDGGVTNYGSIVVGTPNDTYTLGVATDNAGAAYFAVANAGTPDAGVPNPLPGIYKIAAGSSTGAVFSLGSAATPAMNFPNGLDFVNNTLYVADSEGVIYEVNAGGVASVWSQDTSLSPQGAACNFPLPIGANGIVHDTGANNFYVTNTAYGRLIQIPINTNGTAGTPIILHDGCDFVGADGILFDTDGSLIVALNIQNKVVRVSLTTDGGPIGVADIVSGPPLFNPASPVIDFPNGPDGGKRLLVTSPAFFLLGADAGAFPNIATFPLQ